MLLIFYLEYILFLVLIGVFIGFSSGLLGIGGGFLMVPLQFFLLSSVGVEPNLALRVSAGTSLAIIIPTSLSGAYNHYHKLKHVFKKAVLLGVFGVVGGFLGGITSSFLPSELLKAILGIFLILIAILMVYDRNPENTDGGLKFNLLIGTVCGFLTGFFSGLLGIGGGIILIPLLVFVLGFSLRESIGISSVFISLTAIGGVISYIVTGLNINANFLPYSVGYINLVNFGVIAMFAMPMAYLGSKITYKIPERKLKIIFAILMVYMGLKILGLDLLYYLLKLVGI